MLGSAAQNVIALTDSVFLYHLSETDFAAIGFVSVFYMMIAAIGYGFSKGGQIIIARRYGQLKYDRISAASAAMVSFELILAFVMFLIMQFGTPYIFASLLDSQELYDKSLEYIWPRSWGVFFSYLGVSIVALYTGVARTTFIIIDTVILAVANIILNYGLIFGALGMPQMGIAGAGYASFLAEALAFIVFVAYMFFDPMIKKIDLFRVPDIEMKPIRMMVRLSSPIVAQSIVGIGSWFIFFGLVENLGERALAITNMARIIYLVLCIPSWGFSAGINTLVSNALGASAPDDVWLVTRKTMIICVVSTMVISIPVLVFPKVFLYPLLGSEDMSLMVDAQPIFYILIIILFLFSIGVILLNALTGAGKTLQALKLQFYATVIYLGYTFFVIKHTDLGLEWAWISEVLYWIIIIVITGYFFYGDRWKRLKG
ncbi:MAG: MATE family efflux transporter [Saprospiraceae bacterium]|nr:MATE family efflux transporter [Saprospiraceae bacterium]